MSFWTQLDTYARKLESEDPGPLVLSITRTGRLYERIHERGYYVCPCGKLFTDIRSKSMHQAWCRTMTNSSESVGG
jgi:hypothetical protein